MDKHIHLYTYKDRYHFSYLNLYNDTNADCDKYPHTDSDMDRYKDSNTDAHVYGYYIF